MGTFAVIMAVITGIIIVRVIVAYLPSIHIKKGPKPLKALEKYLFEQLAKHNDPMEKLDLKVKVEYYEHDATFTGLLEKIKKQYALTEVRMPLPEKQKDLFLKLTETKFPADFLELSGQTNGFVANGDVRVHGFGAMWSLDLEDSSNWVLAEKEGGTLSLQKSRRNPKLKYHSTEDETDARDLGSEFLSALDTFMR